MSFFEIDSYTTTIVKMDDDEDDYSTSSLFLAILLFVWVVAGIVGFLWSIMCFGRSGTMSQQIVGLLLAVFFGPLYWLYFFSVKKYCRA